MRITSLSAIPEADLILACKEGNRTAINELFQRHYSSSLKTARAILRCEPESQDAVQSAYLSALRHLDSFREEASFKTWITRIVTNFCLIQIRERKYPRTWLPLEDVQPLDRSIVLASPSATPEEIVSGNEYKSAYARALSRLPPQLREVYALRHVSELSLKEVAAQLGLTIPATKSRLFRAGARMRRLLRPVLVTRREAA